MTLPSDFLETWQYLHPTRTIELLRAEDRPRGSRCWTIVNEIKPVDLYCYLWRALVHLTEFRIGYERTTRIISFTGIGHSFMARAWLILTEKITAQRSGLSDLLNFKQMIVRSLFGESKLILPRLEQK